MERRELNYLRDLAKRVAEYSASEENLEKAEAWKRHNTLEPGARPMILCDPENGWNEIIPPSGIKCSDPYARSVEFQLRKDLFSFEMLKDDRILENVYYIGNAFTSTGWGLSFEHHAAEVSNGAYKVVPSLDTYEKLETMHFPELLPDETTTAFYEDMTNNILGDILQVKRRGCYWWSLGLSNLAVECRGLENLMLDMYDNPDELHRLMEILCRGTLHMLDVLEQRGMLYQNTGNDYVGSGGYGFTDELGRAEPGKVKTSQMWGFTESQETVSVSPEMFGEFIFPYQLRIAERFGLNCYGCCEPLDGRWKYARKIPRLRRVSVSHWADAKKMAEYIGDSAIFSLKPSPSYLALEKMEEEPARVELREKIDCARAGCCHLEIIMKDNHTLGNNPMNAVRWVEIAKEEVLRQYS